MESNGTLAVLRVFARQELTVARRSRWMQIFAIVFASLTLAIAASGYILSGGNGIQDFARTAASLLQLVLLIVPLAALLMAVLALTPEPGGAELLFAQPVPRGLVLAGSLLGLFEALAAAQILGFGAAGIVIFLQAGDDGLASYLLVAVGSLALTAVFLALGAVVSIGQIGRRRIRAIARALVLWFVLALVFDIAVLGVASLLRSGHASRLLIVSCLVNPIDAVRTGVLLGVEGTAAFGPASLALLRFTGSATATAGWILMSLVFWISLPAALATRRLARIDIV